LYAHFFYLAYKEKFSLDTQFIIAYIAIQLQ